jgi:hypothetical protein
LLASRAQSPSLPDSSTTKRQVKVWLMSPFAAEELL